MATKFVRAIIVRFVETGKLGFHPVRGRKHVSLAVLLAHLQRLKRAAFCSISVFPYSALRKVVRNIMNFFLYQIHHTDERDKLQRFAFAVCFLNRMTDDLSWQ